jgi:spermidine/putrescine transport system permease protein
VRTSLSVALCSAVVATALGFAGAYVDYRYRFVGKNLYLALLTLPPLVPVVILGLAMLTFQSRIGLAGSVQGLIVGHIVLCAPFALALIRMRLASLDPDIEAAAWNLGATQLSTLRSVILPFCLPTILACLFLTAAVSFDEFMIAWFVGGTNETLPVRVLAMLQGQVSPRINAVGTLVFGLSIALVLISQLFNPGRRGRTQN